LISLKARILAILLQVPRTDADKIWDADNDYRAARLEVLAEAIDSASGGNRVMAGALVTMTIRETALDSGWSSCNCEQSTCDNGRAHGPFQQHDVPSWPREWWPSFCHTMWLPAMTLAARLIAARIKTNDLECSFAHLGAASVPCDAPWAIKRAEMARDIAAQLKTRKSRRK
jgi:hypothetical protein